MGPCLSSKEPPSVHDIWINHRLVLRVFRTRQTDLNNTVSDIKEVLSGIVSGVNCSMDLLPVLLELGINLIDLKKAFGDLECAMNDMTIYSSEFQSELNYHGSVCDCLEKQVQDIISVLKDVLQIICKNSGEENIPVSTLIVSTLHNSQSYRYSYQKMGFQFIAGILTFESVPMALSKPLYGATLTSNQPRSKSFALSLPKGITTTNLLEKEVLDPIRAYKISFRKRKILQNLFNPKLHYDVKDKWEVRYPKATLSIGKRAMQCGPCVCYYADAIVNGKLLVEMPDVTRYREHIAAVLVGNCLPNSDKRKKVCHKCGKIVENKEACDFCKRIAHHNCLKNIRETKMGSCLSCKKRSYVRHIENKLHNVIDNFRDVVYDMGRIEVDLREVVNRIHHKVNCSSDLKPVLQEFGHKWLDLTYVVWELEFVTLEMITHSSEFQQEFYTIGSICDYLRIVIKNFLDLLEETLQKINIEPTSPESKMIHSTLYKLKYFMRNI
ncbi:unnamed protein product [Orchesella dallaii]|uniref:Phorbol-ester/DAG-type domain-containing protein n=1 Tax=Orchesella dallaii TaxID=48710 RepID=A0ABP1S7L6_9HEXA